ncbi:MAG: hypothetical protein NW206_19070 [Hyphomonadaceae bacterium]|nr:hypothetical protein [Hyphomonadaceae bacterium]
MLRKLAATLVFAAGAALIGFADSPVVRYLSTGKLNACAVRQYQNLPQRVDVLALGSSRMRRGFDPNTFVEASGGRIANVYNLAAPGLHLIRSANTLDDLLDSGHSIGTLIVEADIDALRLGKRSRWNWTPIAARSASWADIFAGSPRTLGRGQAVDPRIVLRGALEKLRQVPVLILTGRVARVLAYPSDRATTVCFDPNFDVETPGKANSRARAARAALARADELEEGNDNTFVRPRGPKALVEIEVLQRIRERARQAGIRLIVVRPSGFAEAPLHPETVASLKRLVPEFQSPPMELAEQLNDLQIDATHYGPEGRRLYTQWLAEIAISSAPN